MGNGRIYTCTACLGMTCFLQHIIRGAITAKSVFHKQPHKSWVFWGADAAIAWLTFAIILLSWGALCCKNAPGQIARLEFSLPMIFDFFDERSQLLGISTIAALPFIPFQIVMTEIYVKFASPTDTPEGFFYRSTGHFSLWTAELPLICNKPQVTHFCSQIHNLK